MRVRFPSLALGYFKKRVGSSLFLINVVCQKQKRCESMAFFFVDRIEAYIFLAGFLFVALGVAMSVLSFEKYTR